MPIGIVSIGGTPYSVKFRLDGDGVDTTVIIDNATILAAIGSQKSFLRDVLTATYANQAAAQNAITNTPEIDLRVDPVANGGLGAHAWAAEIDVDKAGLPVILVSTDVAAGTAGCYVKLIFEHTYTR